MDDLTREFLLESQEGLDRMERSLTLLETRPEDSELLAEIFRAVHTIKGATGFLGFARLEALSHAGENLLVLLRDGKLTASPEIVTAILQLMDRLRAILQTVADTGKDGTMDAADEQAIHCLEALQHATATSAPLEEAALATAARPRKGRSGSRRAGTDRPTSRRAPHSSTAIKANSALAPLPPATNQVQVLQPAPEKVAEPQKNAESAIATTNDSTLRVDVELLNRMMNLVGELVLTRNQILATRVDAGFALLGRRLDMVTTDLRESVMRARMQPVNHVFSRFPRLVRDLTLSLGKHVRLEMEGQETELDKSLLEAIRDPLTHSIRNAIDHGIESPEIREAKGKPVEGLVRLRAYHEGSHVVVEVQDDGAGMDADKIRAKAVERQLLTQAKADLMNAREILQLIFLPGFSTASSVTNVSGRGVGMDVVRTNVEKIGGKVELESEAGAGTVVRLRIPLTLAIVPALIVKSQGHNFAVPQVALTELVHLKAGESDQQIEWLENAALYRLRGNLLPLIFLSQLLQQDIKGKNAACDIAVLNADGHRFGLVVDGVADPEEIVVKPLAGILRDIGFYAGATILGNGAMALILNPSAIAKSSGIRFTPEVQESETKTCNGDTHDFLLLEAKGRRAALPLETVVRIERIPKSRVEQAGSRPVLRFDGELLPLDDAAAALNGVDAGNEDQTTIVVCREGERHVGVTVSQVLDVTGGQQLQEAGSQAIADGVTLLQERVTEIIPLSRIPALDSSLVAHHRTHQSVQQELKPEDLAGKEVCAISVGSTSFGVPIAHLLEILESPDIQPVPLAPAFIGGLVHYRGEVLTAVSLRKLLGMEPRQTASNVLVLESPNGPFGLCVDNVSEIFRVTDAEYEPNPSTLDSRRQALFAGEWKLKDRLLVSLEPERLDPLRLARALPS